MFSQELVSVLIFSFLASFTNAFISCNLIYDYSWLSTNFSTNTFLLCSSLCFNAFFIRHVLLLAAATTAPTAPAAAARHVTAATSHATQLELP